MQSNLLLRRAALIAVLLVAFASIRIAATWTVFNHTSDEPLHILAGVEWLTTDAYRTSFEHPPLSRVLAGLGAAATGARIPDLTGNAIEQSLAVLYDGGQYKRRLLLARLGVLPLFWAACAVLWFWSRRWYGTPAALAVLFLFTFLPPVLAHAGLATTDMALVAGLLAALAAFLRLLAAPSASAGAIFGIAAALAVLSKLSALPFFPVAIAGALAIALLRDRDALRRILPPWRRLLPSLAVATAAFLLTIWAGYKFSWGASYAYGFHMPAPEFADGIYRVNYHNKAGHHSWLLGQFSTHGFWYYYPVALAVKLPIPFLILIAAGVVTAWKHTDAAARVPLGLALGILGFSTVGNINIGVRHVLPAVALLAMPAALAAAAGLRYHRPWMRHATAALLFWFALSSAAIHPDYIAYFNAFAGSEPENVLVDSDLDWGQDMDRLAARLRELNATQVAFFGFSNGRWEAEHGFPKIVPLHAHRPEPGWNAISLTLLKLSRLGARGIPGMEIWTDRIKPTERIGKGIFLYRHPPAGPH